MRSILMSWRLSVLAWLVLTLLSQGSFAETTATLRMTFRHSGEPTDRDDISPDRDINFCGQHRIPDESLVVNPADGGIQNVIVYLDGGKSPVRLPPAKAIALPVTHLLKAKHCRFDPHVILAKKGDKLEFHIDDPIGHNVQISFFRNPAIGVVVPRGETQQWLLRESEPVPIPVRCNIHPWMRAYLVVLDHPFVACSDASGKIEINDLPAGEKLVFRVFHESGRIRQVDLEGRTNTWPRGRFEVVLKPGVNDLGVIEVPANSFDLNSNQEK